MFGNPVPGRIQAKSEAWLGTPNFRVTSTFAEHVASGRGSGIDFGNGRCGDPVLAVAAGVVSQVYTDSGNGALIVRIRHDAVYVTGYAHLSSAVVKQGQAVSRGQTIGYVGKTGADACHLHFGVNKSGTEVDGWPLLDQNVTGSSSEVIQGTNQTRLVNKETSTKLADTNFRADPSIANPPLGKLPAGTVFYPDFQVTGASVGGSTTWYTGVLYVGGKNQRGYLHSSVVAPLSPAEDPQGGHSDAELAAAVAKAVSDTDAKWNAAKPNWTR